MIVMRNYIQILVLAVLFAVSCFSYADNNQGYSYLGSQQQVDGSIISDNPLVHSFHSTIETIFTLDSNNDTSDYNRIQAINFIKNNRELSSEFVSQALMIGLNNSTEGASLLDILTTSQNFDGGFGAYNGYNSTVLDTALVIESLTLIEHSDDDLYRNAINYIVENQLGDGSFRLDLMNRSSVFVTSKVLISLKHFMFRYPIASEIEEARDFLIEQLATNNRLSAWERASALNAVIPVTSDPLKYTEIVNLLNDQQLTNGSWENSVYTTALVLQALNLNENVVQPIEPSTGIVVGKLFDTATKLPLVGVNIIQTPSISTTITNSVGKFEISGILPESYTLVYQLDGYIEAQQSVTVIAGQIINLGEVELSPIPDKGTISGVIIDAETTSPISGALISVSGGQNISTSSNALGAYHFSIEPGAVNISISADGYQSVHGSAEIIAGQNLNLSPSLIIEGTTEPDAHTSIKGKVFDENTGLPLANVSVNELNSNVTVLSDFNGDFVLDNLAVGELRIELFKIEYQSLIYKILSLNGNSIDLGRINLKTFTAVEYSTLFGSLIDSDTGSPVIGAIVSIPSLNLNTTTDSLGQYELSNVSELSFELSVNGVGYISQSSTITLPKHQRSQINVQLTSTQVNGLVISNLSTETYSYNAYQKIKVNASFVNNSINTQHVELMMSVRDSSGNIITSFPAAHSPIEGEITDSILTVNSNSSLNTDFEWMNGNIASGKYQLTLVARDLNTRQLLSEKAVFIFIAPESSITNMVVFTSPRFTNIEATENIEFKANLINKSNIPVSIVINYRWVDSDGNIIVNSEVDITIQPDEINKSIILENISHHFITSGEYTIEVDVINGVTPQNLITRSIFVAPLVRIEPNLSIEPNRVVPDGDKRVKVKLQLKGSN